MAYAAAAAVIIGTGIQIYSQMQSAEKQAAAQRREAAMKNAQAQELETRQAINEQIMSDREKSSELYAGIDNGTTRGTLGGIMRLRQDLFKNIDTSRREAQWKAAMLRSGADADQKLSSDIIATGQLQATGTALTAAGNTYSTLSAGSRPSSDTRDLPTIQSGYGS
jgi:hypothetical protein